jgi:hypothetical protein
MPFIRGISAVFVALALIATACGSDDDQAPATVEVADPAVVRMIDAQPDAVACAHVNDQRTWGAMTRRATVAIADREQIPELIRLRASQSLYFAMTEVCKGRPASFKPARDAIAGVRSGTYRVQPAQ